MTNLVLLSVAIAVTSAMNLGLHPHLGYKQGDRYFWFIGDGDGQIRLVDSRDKINEAAIANCLYSNNIYWLYTRNKRILPEILDQYTINSSSFDPKKQTVIIGHGWLGSPFNTMNEVLIDAFLFNDDVNIVVVDWSRVGNEDYVTAKFAVPIVGKALARFIDWLASQGLSYENVHLVGFSLGSHLMGNAGRATKEKVARITGLDPAGPLWEMDPNCLAPTDAKYVEIIHTDIFFLGLNKRCGHADHYPNGGYDMPGCFVIGCSHSRSYEYMAASVKYNNILAYKCDTVRDATHYICLGPTSYMGNSDLNKTSSGIYKAFTGSFYPYGNTLTTKRNVYNPIINRQIMICL